MESLEAAIARAGSPVELLRHSTARPHAFPVAPEFTNWRSEQHAWRTTCVLFDQSHHMTDLFLGGPDALKLLSDFGVNTFAGFGPGRAKQYVAVNAGRLPHRRRHPLPPGRRAVRRGGPPDGRQLAAVQRGDRAGTGSRSSGTTTPSTGPPGPPKLYRYELQGPTAGAIVAKLTGGPAA